MLSSNWGTLCGYLRVVEVFPAVSVPRCKDESEYSASLISFLFRSSQVPCPHASGKGSLICYPLHVFWMAIVEPPNAQLFISAGGINFCSTFPLHASYRSPQLFSLSWQEEGEGGGEEEEVSSIGTDTPFSPFSPAILSKRTCSFWIIIIFFVAVRLEL